MDTDIWAEAVSQVRTAHLDTDINESKVISGIYEKLGGRFGGPMPMYDLGDDEANATLHGQPDEAQRLLQELQQSGHTWAKDSAGNDIIVPPGYATPQQQSEHQGINYGGDDPMQENYVYAQKITDRKNDEELLSADGDKVKFDDKHEDMKKSPEEQQEMTEEGWTKYQNDDTGASRDYRDGAPIYKASLSPNKWVISDGDTPIFAIKDMGHTEAHRVAELLEEYGAYSFVKANYDEEIFEVYHPILQVAALGFDDDELPAIADSIFSEDGIRRASANLVPVYLLAELRDMRQKGRSVFLGPGEVGEAKTAQSLQTDPTAAEPNIESDLSRDPGGGNPAIVGDEEVGNGLAPDDVSSELMGDKLDNADVSGAICNFLATLISYSDGLTIEDALSELKDTFMNDESYNEMKGKLESKVSETKEDKPVEEQTANEILQGAPEGPMSGPMGVAAMLIGAPRYASDMRKKASMLFKEVKGLRSKLAQAESGLAELAQLRDKNKKLIAERSVRMRWPRSERLATRMYQIGELGEGNAENLVKKKASELVMLNDEIFGGIEDRVNLVHEKLGVGIENGITETPLTFISNSVTAHSRGLGFGKVKENVVENNNKFGWTQGPRR